MNRKKKPAPAKTKTFEPSLSYTLMLAIAAGEEPHPSQLQIAQADEFGNNTLHYLALYGKLQQSQSLKTRPENWLAKNNEDLTPLDYTRKEELEYLPYSSKFRAILGPRWEEYKAIQDRKALESETAEASSVELF
jgi:hypothetical protein